MSVDIALINGGKKMIHFNVPPFVGTEFKYMHEAVENHKIC